MRKIQETITIQADPDHVWVVAGDIGGISACLPALAESSLDGDIRTCTTADGAHLTERILERNDAERYYAYEITDSPLPVRSYRSVLSVQGHDGHAHVAWSAEIEPVADTSADEVEQMFAQLYRDGLSGLRDQIERR